MEMEEEGLAIGEFIPEERRVRVVGIKIDCFLRTATVRACRVVKCVERDERETVIGW